PYTFHVVGSGSRGVKRDPYARELAVDAPFPNCSCLIRNPRAYPWHDQTFRTPDFSRSEEHTSELQSRVDLVCRLLLEKKNTPSGELRVGAVRPAAKSLSRQIDRTPMRMNRVGRPGRERHRARLAIRAADDAGSAAIGH